MGEAVTKKGPDFAKYTTPFDRSISKLDLFDREENERAMSVLYVFERMLTLIGI